MPMHALLCCMPVHGLGTKPVQACRALHHTHTALSLQLANVCLDLDPKMPMLALQYPLGLHVS